jgi:hypothetical protein
VAIARSLDNPAEATANARTISNRVASAFSLDTMVDGVLAGYADGLARIGIARISGAI